MPVHVILLSLFIKGESSLSRLAIFGDYAWIMTDIMRIGCEGDWQFLLLGSSTPAIFVIDAELDSRCR